MKRLLKIFTIILIMLNILILNVNALGFTFTPTPSTTTVKPEETVKITLKLSNIDAGELGINTFKSILQYDETIFEDIKITSKNNWSITYNDNKTSEQYGTLLAVIVKPGVTEDQEIGEISFKVKKNTEGKKGDIVFKEVATNDGKTSIVDTNKTISISVKSPEDTNNNKILTNDVKNNTNNRVITSTNKINSNAPKIPFVGAKRILAIVFGFMAIVAIFMAFLSYKKYKSIK